MYYIVKSAIIGAVIAMVVAVVFSFIVGCTSGDNAACRYSPYVAVFLLGIPAIFIGGIIGLFVGFSKWNKEKEVTRKTELATNPLKMQYGYVLAFIAASLITFFFYILANESSGYQSLIPWPLMGLLSFGSLIFLVRFLGRSKK